MNKKVFRIILTLLMSIGMLSAMASMAYAQDTTPPTLVDLSIEPTSVDVTWNNAIITVTAIVSDDLSGVSSVSLDFIDVGDFQLVSGDEFSGTYQAILYVPQHSEGGEQYIYHISLSDDANNQNYMETAELLTKGYDITITVNSISKRWTSNHDFSTGTFNHTEIMSDSGQVTLLRRPYPNVQINDEVTTLGNPNTAIASDDTLYAVWEDDRNARMDIFISKSTDGGKTWGTNIQVNDDTTGTHEWPSVAVADDGTIYVAWSDDRNSGNYNIYVSKSTDAGATWSSSMQVNEDNPSITHQTPYITVYTDTVYVVWGDWRNGHVDNYFSRSIDGGTTWSVDVKLNDDTSTTYQEKASLHVANDGTLYAVWNDDRSGFSNIYITYSSDNGNTWNSNVKVNDTISFDSNENQSLAIADDGTLYMVWVDNLYIYISSSNDKGQTWTTSTNPVDIEDINDNLLAPHLAIDNDVLYLAWIKNFYTIEHAVYLSQSSDWGNTWTSPLKISDDIYNVDKSHLDLVIDSANIPHVAWLDYRDSTPDIYATYWPYENYVYTEGNYTSEIYDVGYEVTWDELNATYDLFVDTALTMTIRSGYSSTIDSSWNDWYTFTTTSADLSNIPTGRYIQWRAYLSSAISNTTPILQEVHISWIPSCTTITQIPQSECEALVALYDSTNGANWDYSLYTYDYTPCNGYIGCEHGSVITLTLHDNNLSGTIPSAIEGLTNLESLDFVANSLIGSIPPELGNLTNLEYLYLNSNQFTGTIPIELGNLTNLQILVLDANLLTGTIPPEIGDLTNLQGLYLSDNPLEGALPQHLTNLVNLTDFYFNGTNLCEPTNYIFQTWLYGNNRSVENSGFTCGFDIYKYAPESIPANEPMTYTLEIYNAGNITATNLMITDVVPSGATYIDGADSYDGSMVSWSASELLPDNNMFVQFIVTATETIANSDYGVMADGGIFGIGMEDVVTIIENADTTPPTLADFTFEPIEVNIAESDQPVTFTLWITDDMDGFADGYVYLSSPSGNEYLNLYFDEYNRVDGDTLNGIYQLNEYISTYNELGDWYVSYIEGTDYNGNSMYLDSSQLLERGFNITLTVYSDVDTTPPTLADFTFEPTAVDVSQSSQPVTFTLWITDDMDGFNYGYVYLNSPPSSGETLDLYFDTSYLIEGTTLDGVYQVTTSISQENEAGDWYIAAIEGYDYKYNQFYLNSTELISAGFDITLTVSNEEPILPLIDYVLLSPTSIDISDTSSQPITASIPFTFTVALTNITEGFNYGYVYLSSPSGNEMLETFFDTTYLLTGDAVAGTYHFSQLMERTSEQGDWYIKDIVMYDVLDTYFNITSTELISMGFEITLTVESADMSPPELLNFQLSHHNVVTSWGTSSADIGVLLTVTDDMVGVSSGSIDLISPSGALVSDTYFDKWNLIAGNTISGTYQTYIYLDTPELGDWRISSVSAYDVIDNHMLLDSTELIESGYNITFTVATDTIPPNLFDLTITPSEVDVSNSDKLVTITAIITDDFSGVISKWVRPIIYIGNSMTDDAYQSYLSLVAGDAMSGTYQTVITISQYSPADTWSVRVISATDISYNQNGWDTQELTNMGMDSTFNVTMTATPIFTETSLLVAYNNKRVYTLEPTTGITSHIATLDVDMVHTDKSFVVDSDNHKAYLFGVKENEDFSRLYTIDLSNGSVDDSMTFENELHLDTYQENHLVAFNRYIGKSFGQIISIDTTTGVTSTIASMESGIILGTFTVDAENHKAYFVSSGDMSIYYLYTTDLTTGNVITSPIVGRISRLESYQPDILIGSWWDGDEEKLITYQTTTGITNVITSLNLYWKTFNSLAVDSINHMVFEAGKRDFGNIWRLYIADIQTGEVMWSTILGERPPKFDLYMPPTEPEPSKPMAVTLTANPNEIYANGISSTMLSAYILDQFGKVMTDGTIVTFTTDLGTLADDVVTTVSGMATTTMTSQVIGTATVMATAGNVSDTVSVTFIAEPVEPEPGRTFQVNRDGFNFENFDYYGADWEQYKKAFSDTDMELADGTHRKGPELYFHNRYRAIGDGGNCAGFTGVSLVRFLGLTETVELDLLSIDNQAITITHDLPEGKIGDVTVAESDVKDYIHLYQARQMSYQFGKWWGQHWDDTPLETYQAIKTLTESGQPVAVSIRFDYNGKTAGHRMTAYHAEDSGNTAYIYVYDSNHPRDENKVIKVSLTTGQWRYNLWGGTYATGTDTGLRYSPADVNFPAGLHPEDDFNHRSIKAFADGSNDLLISIDGSASVLIDNGQGKKIGYENGQLVNTISGAALLQEEGFNPDTPQATGIESFFLPAGSYNVSIKPTSNTGHYTLTTFAAGSGMQLSNIEIATNTTDSLALSNGVLDSTFTPNSDDEYCHYITSELSDTGSRDFESCVTAESGTKVEFNLDANGDSITIGNTSDNSITTIVTIDEVGNKASHTTVLEIINPGESTSVSQPDKQGYQIYLPIVLK